MFPRDLEGTAIIQDGRWKLEPHPVAWTLMPALSKPVAWRRDPGSGLTAVLMSPAEDCFAVSSPQQADGHRSIYFSLFGRSLKARETARARLRLIVSASLSDPEVTKLHADYLQTLR